MADLGNFDASEVEPSSDFGAIPPGRYEAIVTATEWRDTSSGNGRYLKLTLQVVGGPHDGHVLFDNLNLENPSEKAVQIARGTLSRICRAVGVMKPRDSEDLHGLPLVVRVENETYEGQMYNRVKGYYAKDGGEEKKPSKASPAPAQAAGGGGAPWSKKK